ncbi:MAG TPA: phospholipase A [Burkholderiales bacterium]|nr:phospholipase A [Burkholderiales bacterium]
MFFVLVFFIRTTAAADWVIASADARAEAGARFEIVVVPPLGQPAPSELTVRMGVDVAEIALTMRAAGPAQGGRRVYGATMPVSASGPVTLRLADWPSNLLVIVAARGDAVHSLTGRTIAEEREPPLSENDPMYFIIGTRGGTSARFQLSFKYRLFDVSAGIGQERPWLSGLYFGYTQNSLWDLSTESKAFRDTSYRPSLFWKWERADDARALFDGARLGVEHESNGGEDDTSRSINIAFVRPEWRWRTRDGASFEFTPKIYSYLDKEENTDIAHYRGYVDWRARFDSGGNWIATTVFRYGTADKGSILLDVSRRTRDVKIGPVSGYLHMQFFAGYGESILDYNVKRKSQLRFGFAIVP